MSNDLLRNLLLYDRGGQDELDGVVGNYIVPGLTSLLFQGKVRTFHARREQEHFVVPHSHRYDFAAYVVSGAVLNTRYVKTKADGESYAICEYDHNTGQPRHGELGVAKFGKKKQHHPAGSWYFMKHHEYHTIWFKNDSVVLIIESATQYAGYSRILEPFVNGEHLRTFHRADWMQK